MPNWVRVGASRLALLIAALFAFIGVALAASLSSTNGDPKPLVFYVAVTFGVPAAVAMYRRRRNRTRRIRGTFLLGFLVASLLLAPIAVAMLSM